MKIITLKVGILNTNCYLLISENEMIIVDPGDESNKILEEIKKTKAKPKYIINTHWHPDHILANKEVAEKTGAKILTKLTSRQKIKIGKKFLKIIETPGHSKDSICLMANNFILTGDTLFKDGYGRTDLPGGCQKEIEKSLEKISKIVKPGMTIYPGHGENFKVIPQK